ncbi:hypothetical protein Q31b_11820 [Novipirellula aureliae]|uniref:BON domain protein n=1 Tax=Novipirellula aureliae TaxID=2527966 RepID=A0A5C6EC41_9BACT|nr:hypothetical protein [Novipirellula aureliae]TWU46004.1 hypothetical protein Q31b_11820 [Novipirellula aureliae]
MQLTDLLRRCGLFLSLILVAVTADAQMFGARTLGQPFEGRRTGTTAADVTMESSGVVEGDERFLRENRSRNDYVGNNRQSLEGFVGSEQAIGAGRVPASTETMQPPADRSSRINRPFPPLRPNQMYYPRLTLDASDWKGGVMETELINERDARLEGRLSKTARSNIEVYRAGDRTILRGTVSSEQVAEKLRIIASFEPHVDEIEDQLFVVDR